MPKERQSNFEFLRIIAMILIVASHYAGYIQPEFLTGTVTFNRVLSQTLCFGGGAGNIIFFLISGYFWKDSVDNKKHILRLWLEMFFYSILCMGIAAIWCGERSIRAFVAAILPFSHGEYWFMTAYIVLMLLMPYINIVIRNLDKKMHQKLLIIFFVIVSLIPTMPGGPSSIISDVGFYFFIYLIGIYLKRYPDDKINNIKLDLAAAVVLLIGITGSVVVFDILGMKHSFFVDNAGYFLRMSSPLVIFWVLSVFCIFRNIKMKYNKFINYISASVLGVYLIHNNKNIRYTMWDIIFKDIRIESPYMVLHLLASVIGIFVICILIDALRREIIEKPLLRLFDKHIKLFRFSD